MFKRLKNRCFWISLFVRQNEYHKYSVLFHTLAVTTQTIKAKQYKMITAALLHDIGKPFSAYQKPEDIEDGYFSFTNHEEFSYHIIKNWPFISDYTKNLVRYHYIIRDLGKSKKKGNLSRHYRLKKRYDKLNLDFQKEIALFMSLDDKGKKSFLK